MKNAPVQKTNESVLASTANANDTAQQTLPGIDPPPFRASWPNSNTLPADVLNRLLNGEYITQPSYGVYRWRLAAYINELVKLGWPIKRCDVPHPQDECKRPIRMYWLSQDTIQAELAAKLGAP
jgi:hypothetical protein